MDTDTDTIKVPFGLSEAIPPGTKAAWGARFIVNMNGYVDLPPDRQGFAGGSDAIEYLRGRMTADIPLGGLMLSIGDMLLSGRMNTRVAEEFVLDDCDDLVVIGNTKASAGYCYVVCFIK